MAKSEEATSEKTDSSSTTDHARRAKEHTIAGGALGAASVGSLAVFGTVACPLCLVAAPALLCSGAWNAHKHRKRCADEEASKAPNDGADGTIDDPVPCT